MKNPRKNEKPLARCVTLEGVPLTWLSERNYMQGNLIGTVKL
jgi:hypothetical protein